MESPAAIGVGAWRLLRSHSPMETAGFWIALTLFYLALSILAGTRGVGYTERVHVASRSITFDLNPVLWLPDLLLHAYPPTNPVPYLLWWLALAAVSAEGVMVLMRILRGDARPGRSEVAEPHRSRSG